MANRSTPVFNSHGSASEIRNELDENCRCRTKRQKTGNWTPHPFLKLLLETSRYSAFNDGVFRIGCGTVILLIFLDNHAVICNQQPINNQPMKNQLLQAVLVQFVGWSHLQELFQKWCLGQTGRQFFHVSRVWEQLVAITVGVTSHCFIFFQTEWLVCSSLVKIVPGMLIPSPQVMNFMVFKPHASKWSSHRLSYQSQVSGSF